MIFLMLLITKFWFKCKTLGSKELNAMLKHWNTRADEEEESERGHEGNFREPGWTVGERSFSVSLVSTQTFRCWTPQKWQLCSSAAINSIAGLTLQRLQYATRHNVTTKGIGVTFLALKLLWRPHFLGKAESALKNATRLSHTSSWIWQRFLHKLICPPSPPHILKNIKGMEHGRSEKAMSPLWSQT